MTTPTPPPTAPGPDPKLLIGGGVLAVVALIIGVLVATGGGGDSETATAGSTTTSIVGQPAGEAPTDAGVDGAPASTVADGAAAAEQPGAGAGNTTPPAGDGATPETTDTAAPTATAAPAPTTTAAPQQLGTAAKPGPAVAPRAGVYTYRTVTGTGETSESDTKIVEVSRSGANVVQKVESSQQGLNTVDQYEWSSNNVLITKSTYTFNGESGDCDWNPDVTTLVLPVTVGSSWSNDTSCTVTGIGATPIVVQREGSSRVTGFERRSIAGVVLDLWIIEGNSKAQFSGITIEGTAKTWFSPEHGLVVRIEAQGSGGTAAESQEGSFTSELQNLDPK